MSVQMAIFEKKKKRKIRKIKIVIKTKERKKKIGLQRMFAVIRVLNNNIENFKMVKDDTQRPIGFLNSRIRTKTEF